MYYRVEDFINFWFDKNFFNEQFICSAKLKPYRIITNFVSKGILKSSSDALSNFRRRWCNRGWPSTTKQDYQLYFFLFFKFDWLIDLHLFVLVDQPSVEFSRDIFAISSSELRMQWALPYDKHIQLYDNQCRVTYRVESTSLWIMASNRVDPDDLEYTISGLEPYTNYEVQLTCFSEVGNTSSTTNGRTAEAGTLAWI